MDGTLRSLCGKCFARSHMYVYEFRGLPCCNELSDTEKIRISLEHILLAISLLPAQEAGFYILEG